MKKEKMKNGFIHLSLMFIGVILMGIIIGTGIFMLSHQQKNNVAINSQVKHTSLETESSYSSVIPSKAQSPTQREISISKDGFAPATLLIGKGQQVTWVNNDNSSHQVVTNLPALSETDPLGVGESLSFTFDTPGEYTFKDPQNPKFSGKIIVE